MPLDWQRALAIPLDQLPLAFVDVETTGLYAERGDRVCEIAVVVYVGKRELRRFSSLVNPQRPISPGASAVNGLTDEMVCRAPTFPEVAAEVAAILTAGVPVAHNAPFDLSFLARELALAGLAPAAQAAVDTLALARRLLPYQRHGLPELARFFAIAVPGQAHRALADALTTRQLLGHLLARAGYRAAPTLQALAAQQRCLAPWPSAVPQPPPLPPELAEMLAPGRLLRIVYVTWDGRRTERLVEPANVYASGDAVYLVAHCHLRGQQRTFRLDRIVAWEPA